jgi:hypothetical protein
MSMAGTYTWIERSSELSLVNAHVCAPSIPGSMPHTSLEPTLTAKVDANSEF